MPELSNAVYSRMETLSTNILGKKKGSQGEGFKKHAPGNAQRDWTIFHKYLGHSDICKHARLKGASWAKRIKNVSYHIHVCLSRKYYKDEDSPGRHYASIS